MSLTDGILKSGRWWPRTRGAVIRAQLEASGNLIGDMDMLIAASAVAGGYVLVTNNVRHFQRIEGLIVENWAASQ